MPLARPSYCGYQYYLSCWCCHVQAGHDINYISLTGALHSIGPKEGKPSPPLNLVGDFGGGGMLMAFGMVCGILEARTSGQGQTIDAVSKPSPPACLPACLCIASA